MRNGVQTIVSSHLIGGILCQRILVDEERTTIGKGRIVELYAIPIDVEGRIFRVVAQDTPGDKDLAVGLAYGHHATIQLLRMER